VSHCRANKIDNLRRSRADSEASHDEIGFGVEQTFDGHLFGYLINEGISEKMWPPISRRVEEEANWVFFV
jgi:hypothetical protein